MLSGSRLITSSRSLAAALVLFGISQVVFAQTEASDVHIQPRTHARSQPGSENWPLSANVPTIRKNVDLVLVSVKVTDRSNRLITGLDQENFQLFEGKEPQQIKHFSCDDAPVSIGIILDVSGSMDTKIERARESIMQLLKTSNPQDEFFLLTFSDAPQLLEDFTQNPDDLQNRLLFAAPKGRTALLDAIYLGIQNMKKTKYQRKALLIVSDGGDNHSRYSEIDVRSLVKEADVLIYSIGIFDADFRSEEERLGPELLSEISLVTGAASFTLDNPNDLPEIMCRIAMELRNQYVFGYRPNTSKRDGKYRKIKVKLILPRGISALHAQARAGYYAPSE